MTASIQNKQNADQSGGTIDCSAADGHRPRNRADVVRYPLIGDPEGGAQDVRRFSMRQDASSKNPDFTSDGRFELDLKCFFGYFLCAKESNSRTSAKKIQGVTLTP
ncbi:MAG: hypothetical protein HOP03_10825 [Lysobacter sp.]|nr:hypothetical protein [Lysobacter sp.]